MTRYGIIDLGSNTIRLCIYEVDTTTEKALTKRDLETLLNYKTMAGLASFVKNGVMTKKGIKKAISTINAHLKRAAHFNCAEIHVFATAVLRNCLNSEEATKAIEEACGVSIRILSNWDEAHLGFIGATLDCAIERGTLVDIGGGSTELTRIERGCDFNNISLPQGSLSSFADYVTGLLPTEEEIENIAAGIETNLEQASLSFYKNKQLYGIGGAIRSAAKVYGDVCNDGERYSYLLPEHLDEILARYQQEPEVFIHQALQTIPDRIHTFIPGCIIIRTVFEMCEAERLDICKCGIREGYLVTNIL